MALATTICRVDPSFKSLYNKGCHGLEFSLRRHDIREEETERIVVASFNFIVVEALIFTKGRFICF